VTEATAVTEATGVEERRFSAAESARFGAGFSP